jgi:hypothetical protein
MSEKTNSLSRRKFLQNAAAISAIGATVAVGARVWLQRKQRAGFNDKNPFAYENPPQRASGPGRLDFHSANRFAAPHPDSRRLICGPDDRLYLAAGNYITVLTDHGTVVSEIALSGAARCVAVASDGLIYAGLRDHVEVFTRDGKREAVWKTPAERTWFTGLAVGANDLFAADAGNRVVLRYDRSGKVIGRIGEKNPARNIPGFVVPSPFFTLALGGDGLLRVNNPGRHQIEAYTPDGDFEFSWGTASSAIEGFCGCCNPIGLALLRDGSCLTCEKGLPRVKIYDGVGTMKSVVAGPELFPENAARSKQGDFTGVGLDATVDSRGRIFILDLAQNDIRLMEANQPGEQRPS